MEDIEILEEMSIALKEHNLNPIVINFDKYNEAISNILKERQADKEKIKELEDKLNEEAYIRVSAGAHNRICELEKENKRLYEENQIYALEGSRVRLQIHIEKNYIPKVKVIEALQDIEDYFDRLNVPDEDIEFIQSIEEELLKDGGEYDG